MLTLWFLRYKKILFKVGFSFCFDASVLLVKAGVFALAPPLQLPLAFTKKLLLPVLHLGDKNRLACHQKISQLNTTKTPCIK